MNSFFHAFFQCCFSNVHMKEAPMKVANRPCVFALTTWVRHPYATAEGRYLGETAMILLDGPFSNAVEFSGVVQSFAMLRHLFPLY